MGTTVTTNVGLIKPDTNESIKANLPTFAGWASQNSTNMNIIDSFFRSDNTTYTVNLTAITTNPTLGSSGYTEGKYVRLFPRMVLVYFRIYMGGAGFAKGSGSYGINLPFTLDADIISNFGNSSFPLGKAVLLNANSVSTTTVVLPVYYSVLDVVLFRLPTGGNVWADTVPFTAEQNDRMSGYLMYPTQDA